MDFSGDLETAWAEYRAIVQSVKLPDVQELAAIETALEAREDPGAARPELPIRLRLLFSERLHDELTEAWSRLAGRALVTSLKGPSTSLRGLAPEVGVSAPYLSQLANGAGPVPSPAVIGKLRGYAGTHNGLQQLPAAPEEELFPIVQRAKAARDALLQHAEAERQPTVLVECKADGRSARILRDYFQTIAERFFDPVERDHIRELLDTLAVGDISLLLTLIRITKDENGAYALLQSLSQLPEPIQSQFMQLIAGLAPVEPVTSVATTVHKERIR